MREKMWSFFILLLMTNSTTNGLYSFHNNRPRFRSDNGHLYIESATGYNISLNIKGQGYINVNNENLLQLIGEAKDAWAVVESFRVNELPSFSETVKNFIPLLEGPKSLSSRITALEMQLLNNTPVTNVKGKGGTVPNAGRLGVRLSNLEKKVSNLVSLLSISECLSNPCQNGGTCMDLYNGFQCNCPPNWQGRLCEVDVDECTRLSHTDLGCQNGAECKNTPGSYECLCAPNWYGLHCTKKKNDCSMSSSFELCGNGVCVNQLSLNGYTCICNQGWTTDGQKPTCTKDVDECKENKHTCSVNPPVECRNTRGSFTCANCPAGFEGDGFVCTDINECLTNNGGCSLNPRVQCINTRGSFKCESCPPGYSGDGFNCVYVTGGACAINNGGCHPNAKCTAYAETSILCTCQQGYTGNGLGMHGCVLVTLDMSNPCEDNPCSNGICIVNRNKTFSCVCAQGYTGKTCNNRLQDPCLINPCHNNGICEAGLEPGEFYCNCKQGYSGNLCDSVQEPCGGHFYKPNGTIRYPESNESLTYSNNINCAWEVRVNFTSAINFTFVWIDVEKSNDCSFDWVEIVDSDSNDGKPLGKFCGNTLPVKNSIVSDSYSTIVRFHSDTSNNFRGFQLNYTSVIPICGSTINIDSNIKHGTLSSPGSPGKYPPNRDCYWTINAIPGKRIQFHFFSFQIESHLNCSFDYLEIRDGFSQNSPILAKLCNTTVPPPILTSGSHANLHFHTDSVYEDYGFQMTYDVQDGIPGCGGIYTAPSGTISSPIDLTSDSYGDYLNCEWHIKMPLNQKLKLIFMKKFGIEPNKNCSTEFLEIFDGPTIKSPLIGRYCGSSRFEQPIITYSNEVTLFFKSDFTATTEGFVIKYETMCGGTYTDNKGIIESPFYPNPYPQDKICIYIIEQPVGKAIQLSFLDMDIEDLSYPNCFYDSLEIRDGDNENSTKIAMLCGSVEKLPKLPYVSTHNYMWLKFSTDHSSNNKGFRANYSTIDIACGGILKESSGIIQSSKNSEEYLHNQSCKWIISVNESSQIQITWLTFSLENHASCKNDYVEIYDNSISGNASKIARYCGTKVPPVLTSMGNRLTIIFVTDHSVSMDGFMLSYISLSKTQACGGNFFTTEGFIKSPNYPDDYIKLKDCTWIITVPVTNQIELNITQFSLEDSFNCRFDYLEIRNGGYRTSPLIGKYCGSKIDKIISSMGNSLFVRFVSDGTRQRKGFFMQWYSTTRGCGGVLNTGIGHIISPNYPLSVSETLECFYKIVVTKGSQIKLTILDLELSTDTYSGLPCKEDFIEFFDGGNTASKSLGTFCSDAHSSSILHSSSNQMYIKFRSSGFSKGRGFSLSYSTDCNVTIKGHHGYGAIEFAKQESIKSDKCIWTIVAPPGSKVNITFTSFKMLHSRLKNLLRPRYGYFKFGNYSTECNDTQLLISQGADISEINTVLWKQCYTDPPSTISSTKNIVRIDYSFRNKKHFLDVFDSFRIEWIVDGCGGTLDRSEGEFKSPGFPGSYPPGTTCEWNIVTSYGYTIEITIQESWFEQSEECNLDFLAIYSGEDDSGPELLRICYPQSHPIIVTSGGNEAFVRFQSDELVNHKGFRATYQISESKCGGKYTAPQGTIHTNNYPQNYDSNSSCMWYIEIAETHLINLTFVDFNTKTYPVGSNDKVLVYDGDIHGKLLLNYSGSDIPPTIISSSNKLLISFEVGKHEIRAKGFKAIYTTACGAKLETNDSGIITSSVIHTSNCSWTIISNIPQSKVTLIFTHLDLYLNNLDKLRNQSSMCSDADTTLIRILDGRDADAPEIANMCTSSSLPPPIISNGPAIRIEFNDLFGGYQSFTVQYSVRSNACGGIYNYAKGTISSPNYPNNYFRDSECIWILKSSIGNRIVLNFIAFELEEDEFCNEDYVEIREQDSAGLLLGLFCGLNLPTNTTSGSSLWVKFHSNSLGSAKGFTADFKYVSENYLSQQSGEIASPMYPKSYKSFQNEIYSWTINVKEGKRIQILLKEFLCLYSFDSLKIYDGSNTDALMLLELKLYKEENKETILSSDNIVFIQFKTEISRGWTMFLISWTQIDKPNSKILYPEFEISTKNSSFDYYLSPSTNSSVIITSPGYPYGYSPNLNISWTIHTDSHNHIEVVFLDVDLFFIKYFQGSCYKDYIRVETVDPNTANTELLKMVCNSNNTGVNSKLISKEKVTLTFISNNAINGTGFKAEVKLKCGGYLRNPTGIIDTTNITDSISTNGLCTWNITVRPGRKILVKFITLELVSANTFSCTHSYVLLKNGLYDDSPVLGLGKYCRNSNVSTLTTTENKLQVQISNTQYEIVKIAYEEISVKCGGEIYLSDAYNITQITSPSYPNIPPAHIECTWIVTAPSGERISASIEDLDLYYDSKCEKEYLEFRDGAAIFSPLLKTVCQLSDIPDIETKDNFLYIKYFTDLTVPSNGFKLNVTIAKCGGIRRSKEGQIASPNYPGSYESSMDCEYRIIVNGFNRIVLNFQKVNLKRRYAVAYEISSYNDTYDDSLTIYDVDPVNSTKIMITKIFGADLPSKPIKSSGRELIIQFKSYLKTNGRLYVKNIHPQFLMSYWTEYNDCDKVYEVESGEIASPSYNSLGPGHIFCLYTIKAPVGRRITVELIEGQSIANLPCDYFLGSSGAMPKEKVMVFQSLNVYQSESCIDYTKNPSTLKYTYESVTNLMTILYTFLSGNQVGFRLKFSSNKPSLCGGTIDASTKGSLYLPVENFTKYFCQWEFLNANGTIVIAASFNVVESILSCKEDNLLLGTDGDLTTMLKTYCPSSNKNDKFIILSPLPITKITVLGNIKKVNYTATLDYYINSCGGIIEGQKVTITSPNYPRNYQNNTNCVWLVKLNEGTIINIRFNDIDLNSTCDSNYVMIHDGPSSKSPVLGKFCGNILPNSLSAISNEIWIEFSSQRDDKKKGFNVTLESFTTSVCGQIYELETGEISTKDYPKLYPNNEECEWIISVLPGNRINLQFLERFSLEKSVNCTNDYVQIFDNINDSWLPIGNRLCGRQMPPEFNSSETKLKVRIRTNNDIQGDGFKAKWKTICGGIFTENSGKIVSPNYPRPYSNKLICNYTILAPEKSIQLTFKSFELEDSACIYDNLTIIKSGLKFKNYIAGTYCGTNLPRPMMFMNSVTMIFQTDSSIGLGGFEIHYEIEGCGGQITTPGLIKSPSGYDEELSYDSTTYANNLNCTWIIKAPPGQVIELVFTKFRLERSFYMSDESDSCDYDAVYVFDGLYLNNSLGVFCGVLDDKLPVIKSNANIMYVQFITDESKSGDGFVGEISFTYGEAHGCGGTIRLDSLINSSSPSYNNFIIEVPKVPVKIAMNCGWLILAPKSYTVKVEVITYTETPKCTLNTTNCSRCSSIKFLDGPGFTSRNIYQFCPGNTTYPNITSSENQAFILYQVANLDVDINFKLRISAVTSVCGPSTLIVTNQTQVLMSPNYPLPYPNNLICKWSLQLEEGVTTLMMHFTDLDLQDTEDCLSNYLEIRYTEWIVMTPTILRVCHSSHEFDLVDRVLSTVVLRLHTDNQGMSKGFRLEYKSSKCQQRYEKGNGRILFEFNQLVSSNGECTFTINVGQVNSTISVYFTVFSRAISKSTLKVYDGPNTTSPVIIFLSDQSSVTPSPIFSSGPALTMTYKSLDQWVGSMDITYTSTDQGRGCGGRLFNTEGTVTSPMYPSSYKNKTCRWDISVPRPYPISIAFRVFSLGPRSTCDTDYVEMFDVEQVTRRETFVAKYCAEDIPAYHISLTGAVFIKYTTSVKNVGPGWILNFKVKRNF